MSTSSSGEKRSPPDWMVMRRNGRGNWRPSVVRVLDVSQDLMMRFVALGFGLSLVSDWSTAIVYPGVAFRPLAGEDHHVSYSAVWLPGNDNPALRRFLSLARRSRRNSVHRRCRRAPSDHAVHKKLLQFARGKVWSSAPNFAIRRCCGRILARPLRCPSACNKDAPSRSRPRIFASAILQWKRRDAPSRRCSARLRCHAHKSSPLADKVRSFE